MTTNIVPVRDYYVVKRIPTQKTAGGIALPNNVTPKYDRYKVLSAGPGECVHSAEYIDTFTCYPMDAKEGDIVIVRNGIGQEIDFDGEDVKLVKNSEIYAVCHER